MTTSDDDPEVRPTDYPDSAVAPADIASAGRSCSAILILLAVIFVILAVSIAYRVIVGS